MRSVTQAIRKPGARSLEKVSSRTCSGYQGKVTRVRVGIRARAEIGVRVRIRVGVRGRVRVHAGRR